MVEPLVDRSCIDPALLPKRHGELMLGLDVTVERDDQLVEEDLVMPSLELASLI